MSFTQNNLNWAVNWTRLQWAIRPPPAEQKCVLKIA